MKLITKVYLIVLLSFTCGFLYAGIFAVTAVSHAQDETILIMSETMYGATLSKTRLDLCHTQLNRCIDVSEALMRTSEQICRGI